MCVTKNTKCFALADLQKLVRILVVTIYEFTALNTNQSPHNSIRIYSKSRLCDCTYALCHMKYTSTLHIHIHICKYVSVCARVCIYISSLSVFHYPSFQEKIVGLKYQRLLPFFQRVKLIHEVCCSFSCHCCFFQFEPFMYLCNIHTNMCVCLCTPTHTPTYMFLRMHLYYIFFHTFLHLIHIDANPLLCVHMFVHVHVCLCMCACLCGCVSMCVYAYKHMQVHIQ